MTEPRCPDCGMILVGPREKEDGLCPLCVARRLSDEGLLDADPFEDAGVCVILPAANQ